MPAKLLKMHHIKTVRVKNPRRPRFRPGFPCRKIIIIDSSSSTKTKPTTFRRIYPEIDSDFYIEEAVLMKIRPAEDGRYQVEDTTIIPSQHMAG